MIFKLGISRLPGIVLFAPPNDAGKVPSKHFGYLPLEEKDFNDSNVYETILDELFKLIRKSIDQHKESNAVLYYKKMNYQDLEGTAGIGCATTPGPREPTLELLAIDMGYRGTATGNPAYDTGGISVT